MGQRINREGLIEKSVDNEIAPFQKERSCIERCLIDVPNASVTTKQRAQESARVLIVFRLIARSRQMIDGHRQIVCKPVEAAVIKIEECDAIAFDKEISVMKIGMGQTEDVEDSGRAPSFANKRSNALSPGYRVRLRDIALVLADDNFFTPSGCDVKTPASMPSSARRYASRQ